MDYEQIGGKDTYFNTAAEINEGFNPKDKNTYVFRIWIEVFRLVNGIKMEIYNKNKSTMKLTEANKKAFKDPRYLAAYDQYQKFKKNFPDEHKRLTEKSKRK